MNFFALLEAKKDAKNANFTKKLIPDLQYKVLGVKVPYIKELAKKYVK